MIDYTTYKLDSPNDVMVLEVTGRLDSSTASFLLDCIQGYIERGEHKIVLDCSELDAISSEGLATFVRAKSRLNALGGAMSLSGVKGGVAEVLRIVHFDRLFNLFPTIDEAAQAFDD